ncbi:MAG TPA: MFS transporter, partial [Agriterribacter sp.]|nr:MFS transporter [Agriterribacter sp.]
FLAIHAHNTDKALELLTRVAGTQEAEREMEQIKAMSAEKILPMGKLISRPFRTATFIALFLAIVSQLSGIDIVLHYGPVILERSGMSFGDALVSQLVFGIVLVIFTSVAMWKIDTWGRRLLLLIGNAGVFISLLFMSYFLGTESFSENGLLIAISCFVASFAVALGPVPWIIMAEIFPSRIRGQAMALATFVLFGTNWLVAQLFPLSVFHLGESATFRVLAICAVPTFFFIWKILPETKGKLLEDSII